ncbi:hypothetical protein ACHAPU_001569 [Fusarium lateritium]
MQATNYSGVAWAYSRQPDVIGIVTSWHSRLGGNSDLAKVPTQLVHNGDEATSWGYSVPADEKPLKWFKLLLLKDADITSEMAKSSQIRDTRDLLEEIEIDAVTAVACYLSKLWDHSIQVIRRSVGDKLMQTLRFHVVITLPAIWPPYAQQRMKQAATKAGILKDRPCGGTTLRFISEPEAAALATINDLSKRPDMKPGVTMVVCDAGGGTVDLISYVVESVNPFTVAECVREELCGGMFPDDNFLNLIKRKISRGAWDYVTKARERKFLNDEWEHGIKGQFYDQQRSWPVELPDGCVTSKHGLKRRRNLELSSNDVLSVFNPIIDKIGKLVRRQTQAIEAKYGKPADYIILVGGFGRNSYLWTAICRGAVVEGMSSHRLSAQPSVRIDTRIARSSYGVIFKTEYARTKHRLCDKTWSEEEGIWEAHNQMRWFLREGSNMSKNKRVREKYYRLFPDDETEVDKISETIYEVSAPIPRFFGPRVQKLCDIFWTQDVDIDSLPTWTNSQGKVFRQLDYDIEMACEDGTVGFAIYFKGSRVGSRDIEVSFQ